MEIVKETLDDLLFETYRLLLERPFTNEATRSGTKGKFSELFGVLLELQNPRARISRSDGRAKIFSALGEWLWYLAGSEDLTFIEYYIKAYREESFDEKTIYGAYGPRFYNSGGKYNQIENVFSLLRENGTSKKAVIQLFESRDIAPELKESKISIPCTCSLQFLQRENKLHMITFMRSNDAFLGLPHDIYAFTMLQEYIANALGFELGAYKHFVSSLHMYEENKEDALHYIKEGVHSTRYYMDPMPTGDNTKAIQELLVFEKKIRASEKMDISASDLSAYWKEFVYLLSFFNASITGDLESMKKWRLVVTNPGFTHILDKRLQGIESNKTI